MVFHSQLILHYSQVTIHNTNTHTHTHTHTHTRCHGLQSSLEFRDRIFQVACCYPHEVSVLHCWLCSSLQV